jgi:hypothetical protein
MPVSSNGWASLRFELVIDEALPLVDAQASTDLLAMLSDGSIRRAAPHTDGTFMWRQRWPLHDHIARPRQALRQVLRDDPGHEPVRSLEVAPPVVLQGMGRGRTAVLQDRRA